MAAKVKIEVPTNHNYYEESALTLTELRASLGLNKSQCDALIKALFSGVTEYTTGSASVEHIQLFGFGNREPKHLAEDKLILKLYSKKVGGEDRYIIQTGLFAGVVYLHGYEFNIKTVYGDGFLKRMLNCINEVMVDNSSLSATPSPSSNEFENIIAYLFVQSLEKAAILGLPQRYQTRLQHSHKVRGKVDINQYLKRSMPFTGKITTSVREQRYEQDIIDILYLTCRSLAQKFGQPFLTKVLGIYQLLAMHYSGRFPSDHTIRNASQHPSLHHPMYQAFRQTLTYANIILNEQAMRVSQTRSDTVLKGYLFDIAQLFELYLEKLLSHSLSGWLVSAQEKLTVYRGTFFRRNMYPDLILTHIESGAVIVFDAKFKRMRFQYRDLDRADFYQIHSYMSYYQDKVVLGGLIYPLSHALVTSSEHASPALGNEASQFMVDGIYVTESMTVENIIDSEQAFIGRIVARLENA